MNFVHLGLDFGIEVENRMFVIGIKSRVYEILITDLTTPTSDSSEDSYFAS